MCSCVTLPSPVLSTRYDADCDGGDNCCSDSEPCGLNNGDCDKDSHCQGELKCGHNNCGEGRGFDPTDDCCVGKYTAYLA